MNDNSFLSAAGVLFMFGQVLSAGFATEPPAPAPALPALHADPHIACLDGTYYIYPTTDGIKGWGASSFSCWSSKDLLHWANEGVILDLKGDLTWANSRAWAPCIAAKNGKYYFCMTL